MNQDTATGQAASDQRQWSHHVRGKRRRGCRGGERRKRMRKDLGSYSKHSGRSPSPSSPSPAWRRPKEPEICYIDRTLDTDQHEATLGVLVQITGTRPSVMLEQAHSAIANKYGIRLDEQLEIHAVVAPFDFFLILPDHVAYLTVLNGDRTVHTPDFSLSIRPWSRLVYADHGELYHKVQIELEGIPPHVWQASTAVAVLRPYCSLASIHSETTARRDLSVFKRTTWTTRPERIPDTKIIAVPEPTDDDSLPLPMRRMLKYSVQIRVRRLLLRLPPDSPLHPRRTLRHLLSPVRKTPRKWPLAGLGAGSAASVSTDDRG